jgi:hypothetical protein
MAINLDDFEEIIPDKPIKTKPVKKITKPEPVKDPEPEKHS